MDDRQAQYVRQFVLRHRKPEAHAVGAVHELEADVEFAHQVRELADRLAATHADQPLAMHGRVDQRVEPQKAGKVRRGFRQFPERFVLDLRKRAVGQRQDAMGQHLEQEAVQVEEVAGNVQRRDLAAAVLQHLEAGGKPSVNSRLTLGLAPSRTISSPALK